VILAVVRIDYSCCVLCSYFIIISYKNQEMNTLYHAAGKAFGGSWWRRQQTRGMDPTTRRALQSTVAEETNALEDDIAEVQAELAHAIEQWNTAVKKEQFLALRARQYRKVLDERARELKAERNRLEEQRQARTETTDEEEGEALEAAQAELERRMEKWERDVDALDKIVETQKEILTSCEEMRRNIVKLEKKKEHIMPMANECKNFLTTADEADNEASERQDNLEEEAAERDDQRNQVEMTTGISDKESAESSTAEFRNPSEVDDEEQWAAMNIHEK
jgi:chromosome segregation ATPase